MDNASVFTLRCRDFLAVLFLCLGLSCIQRLLPLAYRYSVAGWWGRPEEKGVFLGRTPSLHRTIGRRPCFFAYLAEKIG